MPHALLPVHALRTLTALALAVTLAACAAPRIDPVRPDLPARAGVAGVPLILQERLYCGPAALAMALGWGGTEVTQAEVARMAFTPGAEGSYRGDMLGAARRNGALAVEVHGAEALLSEIAAGHPVVVFQNLGLGIAPRWHYAVAVAYDREAGAILLHSGAEERMTMDWGVFLRTWARGDYWAMVALPPGRMPATARETSVLRAAAALESLGEAEAAEKAYVAGAARWPESWLWPFGAANARFAQGDLRGARSALLEARRRGPDVPEVRANLAEVERALGN